jgi:hypothetical protein
MITTVTISTVTTVTTAAAVGLTAVVSGIVIVGLIAFLATKELASASSSGTALRVARYLGIAIIPMLMAFAVIMTVKVIDILAA